MSSFFSQIARLQDPEERKPVWGLSPKAEVAVNFPGLTFWLRLSLIFAFVIPVIGYGVLPILGIDKFQQSFGLNKTLMLALLPTGLAFLLAYMRLVAARPQLLAAFLLQLWSIVDALNHFLLVQVGLNLHMRPLLLLCVVAPGFWMFFKNIRLLWNMLPWLKYYVLFIVWLLGYFLLNNANAMDPRLNGGDDSFFEGSVSVIQLTAYMYCLLSIALPALAIGKIRNYRRLFDTFNTTLLWISSLLALLTIVGYPFGLFNRELDGFTRAMGIFTHPNPFAHHMGVLMVYLLGLLCYYQGERKGRIASWLLLGGLACNLLAFLLGLSKTALSVFGLCGLLLMMMNLAVPAVRRNVPRLALVLLILAPIGVFGFEALSGQSFFGLVEARIEQTQSLSWRTLVWQELIADLDPMSVLVGHGFTAANATVFQLSFNDSQNAQPLMMVHNAYIALLYDLGVMGYSMFAAVASLMAYAVRGWLQAASPSMRTGYSILLALSVYFLITCFFDEMSYMLDAPVLFWGFVGLIAGVQWRERQEVLSRR